LALYNNIIFWDFGISTGEYVAYYRNPFLETQADPILKVLSMNSATWTGTVKVMASDFLSVGQILVNYNLKGLKRIKYLE